MDNRSIVQGMMVRVGLGVFGLLTVATLVLTVVSDRGLIEVHRKGEQLSALEQQIEALEAENAQMVEEILTRRIDNGTHRLLDPLPAPVQAARAHWRKKR